jgi:hypothetical protein
MNMRARIRDRQQQELARLAGLVDAGKIEIERARLEDENGKS